MADKDLTEAIRAEILHNISPVIGWLRRDAQQGRVDTDGSRLAAFDERVDLAAKAIAELVTKDA